MKPQKQTINEALAITDRVAKVYKIGTVWHVTVPQYGRATRTHPTTTWADALTIANTWAASLQKAVAK